MGCVDSSVGILSHINKGSFLNKICEDFIRILLNLVGLMLSVGDQRVECNGLEVIEILDSHLEPTLLSCT